MPTQTQTDLDFYLVSEIAEKLRVSEMTIYRYIKAGRMDAYKFGKEFRVTKEAFENFLKEHDVSKSIENNRVANSN